MTDMRREKRTEAERNWRNWYIVETSSAGTQLVLLIICQLQWY